MDEVDDCMIDSAKNFSLVFIGEEKQLNAKRLRNVRAREVTEMMCDC